MQLTDLETAAEAALCEAAAHTSKYAGAWPLAEVLVLIGRPTYRAAMMVSSTMRASCPQLRE